MSALTSAVIVDAAVFYGRTSEPCLNAKNTRGKTIASASRSDRIFYGSTLAVEWPRFCSECVQIINSFTRCSHNPVAFAQLKEQAPGKLSFSSLEEG
jgi:hypothetical protein